MSRTQDRLGIVTCLRNKSSAYAARYDLVHREVESVLRSSSVLHDQLLDYDARLSTDVVEAIDDLLPDALKARLSVEELFLLLCAIQFHRIGLFFDREPNEKTPTILQDRLQRTVAYLAMSYAQWGIEEDEAELMTWICLGLADDDFGRLRKKHILHGAEIRVKFLAALLRLGNLLNCDIDTVIAHMLQRRKYGPSSLRQWIRRYDILGIQISCHLWTINLFVSPEMFESRRLWQEYEGELQRELDLVQPILEENELYYRTIEITLDKVTPRRDQALADRLASHPKLSQTQKHASPYKYLDYFVEKDREIFFGRGNDIERYLDYIRTYALVVLYGESGVGKTSLIRAGLIPKLIDEGCIPVYGRLPGVPATIIMDETRKMVDWLAPGRYGPTPETLEDFFEQQRYIGHKFVVFLDQFEMFLIDAQFKKSDWQEFFNQLIGCLNHTPPLRLTIVLSVRRDYLGKLGEFKLRLKELYDNAFELRQLTEEEVRAAIVEPARKMGIKYEADLVKKMVQDIHQGGNYNTPQIQIVCQKLVASLQMPSERLISLAMYERLGRATGILAAYIKEELERFDDATQKQIKSILKQMVTSQDTKAVFTIAELAQRSQLDTNVAKELLEQLTDRRLLRKLTIQGEPTFELAHEYMTVEIIRWREDDDQVFAYIYETIKGAHRRRDRGRPALLDKYLLSDIQFYRTKLFLNDSEKALIVLSHLVDDPASEEKQLLIDAWVREMQAATVVAELMDTLDTGDPDVYHATVRAIAAKGPEATEHLIPYLAESRWQLRQSAVDALVLIGPATLDAMVALFTAGDRRTRQGAVLVLAKLGTSVRDALEQRLAIADAATAALITETLTLMRLYAVER